MTYLDREDLMDVYKNPANRGALPGGNVVVSDSNPMCGDEITLNLDIKKNIIKDAKFSGSACAVSIISSDLLLEHIKGKTLEDVKKLEKDDLLKLLGLNLTTSRVKCAMLILTALKKGIKKYEDEKNNQKE